uniref:Importin N-terminal domain-containing protein n=2 Tax=Phaeomonas parva TaxID=124430 RepID=A0A7S1UHI3_9STRA
MDLEPVLLACQNPTTLPQAEQHLSKLAQDDLGQLLLGLVTLLATDGKVEPARQLAGIYVKNALSANNAALLAQKLEGWRGVNPEVKHQIKLGALHALQSSSPLARRAGAQVTAKLGSIEVPAGGWDDLVPQLQERVAGNTFPDPVKVASLESLGYMGEELAHNGQDLPEAATNQVLTVIISGMGNTRPNEVRLAATTALRNSVEFANANFQRQNERDMIMQMVCEATQCEETRVRVVAFECISQIAKCYYEHLAPYMNVLAQLTLSSIKTQPEEVALQAVEFWSTLCEEEAILHEAIEDAQEYGTPQEELRPCMDYTKQALNELVPLLTHCLTQQDEDADEGTWNLAMAGSTCLRLVSSTVADDIINFIMPFITGNIQNQDWRAREAAVMAFGSIMDGVSPEGLGTYIQGATPVLITLLQNPNEHPLVKDSTAWTIGRMCMYHPFAIQPEALPQLVESLKQLLGSPSPHICQMGAIAIHNLGAAFESAPSNGESNGLSPFFQPLLEALIAAADREDALESNIRVDAYEAVNRLIQNAAPDVSPVVAAMVPHIIEKLKASFSMQVLTAEDREHQHGLQGLLCGVLQCCSLKLGAEVAPFGDEMLQCYLAVFNVKNAIAHEDAYLAVGALADALEDGFMKYFPTIYPVILSGLQRTEEWQGCKTTVNILGDVCRALGKNLLNQCDEIVRALLTALSDNNLHRNVKPHLLSVFHDLAIAIGGNFERYLHQVMQTILAAASVAIPDEDDEEAIEYLQELRVSVLEAFTGILQGMVEDRKQLALVQYLPSVLNFLERISQDPNRTDELIKEACGVIGDVAWALGPHFRQYAGSPIITEFIKEGKEGGVASQKAASWAEEKVTLVLGAPMG